MRRVNGSGNEISQTFSFSGTCQKLAGGEGGGKLFELLKREGHEKKASKKGGSHILKFTFVRSLRAI